MTKISHYLAQITKGDVPSLPDPALDSNSVTNVLQIVFGLAGGIALLIVAIAGLQYVLSQGDPQNTAKAKNTILYAFVGLLICIFAFSIVSFVIGDI